MIAYLTNALPGVWTCVASVDAAYRGTIAGITPRA